MKVRHAINWLEVEGAAREMRNASDEVWAQVHCALDSELEISKLRSFMGDVDRAVKAMQHQLDVAEGKVV